MCTQRRACYVREGEDGKKARECCHSGRRSQCNDGRGKIKRQDRGEAKEEVRRGVKSCARLNDEVLCHRTACRTMSGNMHAAVHGRTHKRLQAEAKLCQSFAARLDTGGTGSR